MLQFVERPVMAAYLFAWGPDVPTTGRVLVRLRILRSEASDIERSIPRKSGYSMYAGAALDGRVGPAISVRLWDGAYHLQQVASLNVGDGKMLHKIATSRRGDIVRRVFELAIEEGELYVAWEGEERKKVPLPPGSRRPARAGAALDQAELPERRNRVGGHHKARPAWRRARVRVGPQTHLRARSARSDGAGIAGLDHVPRVSLLVSSM